MNPSTPAPRRLDLSTLEMIFVVTLTTLHDFLLSDALSLPLALQHSAQVQLRALDRVMSGLEFLVPVVILIMMLVFWLTRRNTWAQHAAVVYLAWVTLRLVAKVALVLDLIIARRQVALTLLLKDTIVLWFVIVLLFSAWYWVIDGGGPSARRNPGGRRRDFGFPQHVNAIADWKDWQPGFWDYVFLGFSGSTQFSFSDTFPLSLPAKFLLMLQATLSMLVIVFIASIAAGAIH